MNVYGGSVVTSTAAASHLFHALTCYDTTKNTFPYLFEVYNETVLQHVSDCLWAYLILPLLHEIFIVNNRKKHSNDSSDMRLFQTRHYESFVDYLRLELAEIITHYTNSLSKYHVLHENKSTFILVNLNTIFACINPNFTNCLRLHQAPLNTRQPRCCGQPAQQSRQVTSGEQTY